MTTKAKNHTLNLNLKRMIYFCLEERAWVLKILHKTIKNKLKIPINKKTRSLNVAMTVAIVAAEALRQNNCLK